MVKQYYGAFRLLVDSAFTPDFDQIGALLLALVWLTLLTLAAVTVFRHTTAPETS